MKKILFLLLIICTVFTQCDSREKADSGAVVGDDSLLASDNELVQLLIENTQAGEDEDLEKAMEIFDEKMSDFESNKVFTQQVFNLYDLDYEIEKIEVLEQAETEAQVELIHTVKKISGPAFQDQRTRTILHFRKINGAWKVTKRDVQSTDYL